MDPILTNSTLLSRVRDPGDEAAWRQFERVYGELVLRYAKACGLQHCDAEDIQQQVMTKLVRTLPGFRYSRERGHFRDYLRRTTRNTIAEFKSRPNRERSGVEVDAGATRAGTGSPSAEGEPDALWEREWMNHHYRMAMDEIRRTFEARSVEAFGALLAGRGVEESAALSGLTTQAVYKVKQRIQERLRELIVAQIAAEEATDG